MGRPGAVRPRSHLVLRVEDDDGVWHADAGFGSNTPTEPLPFGAGDVHDQDGWRFRIVQDGAELVLQGMEGSVWREFYGFVPEPAPMVDIETSNWYTATHPHSPFVTGLNVGRKRPTGVCLSLSDWSGELTLIERTPSGRTVTPVARAAIPELLSAEFGLAGFALDATGAPQPVR